MTGFVNVEISSNEIIKSMLEDSEFGLEMWREINQKLNMGMLLDDCMDLVRADFSLQEMQMFKGSLDLMSSSLEQAIEIRETNVGEGQND